MGSNVTMALPRGIHGNPPKTNPRAYSKLTQTAAPSGRPTHPSRRTSRPVMPEASATYSAM